MDKSKYESGSLLQLDDGSRFLIIENIEYKNQLYLFVIVYEDEQIEDKLKIDFNNAMILSVDAEDNLSVISDEEIIDEVYPKVVAKIESSNKNN